VKKLRWVPDVIHCQGWMSAVVPFYIKTAYHDEPSFANTKVVTSLFTKTLKGDLGEAFKQSIEFRDAKASLLEPYNDNFDLMELGKLAIDYSDGIVTATPKVNTTLLKYAVDKKIPLLGYEKDFADGYEAFYNQICPDSED
jgi:starch synthase